MSESPFAEAIKDLGGPTKAAAILGRKQPTISGYLKEGNPPADVCMRIEVATDGKYPAEHLRPDLAEDFRAFRAVQPPKAKTKRRAS